MRYDCGHNIHPEIEVSELGEYSAHAVQRDLREVGPD